MRGSFFFSISCLVIFLLSACTTQIFPPLPLYRSEALNASFPSLAIDGEGTKHLVWLEGSGPTKSLIYWRSWFANPTLTRRHTDQYAYLPRIAVTDDGNAYIVWSRWISASQVEYCIWIYPAWGRETLDCFAVDRYGKGIWVIGRRDVVYAVYDRGNQLLYRQLAGGGAQGRASDIYDPEWFLPQISLGIDSNGKLHLLHLIQNGTTYYLFYNSNASVDSLGNMNQQLVIADTGGGAFDLAIGGSSSNERVYFIRKQNFFGSDKVFYTSCLVNGCLDRRSGQIPLGDGWQISELQAVGTSLTTYTAMIARTPASPGIDPQEIYVSVGLGSPQSISETEFYAKRRLHAVTTTTPPLPVFAWRKGISGYSTDVYVAYPVVDGGTIRMKSEIVFSRFEPYIEPEGDSLAANGEWVAGVWLYHQSPTSARIAPWIAGNAHLTTLPVVSK